MPLSLLRSRELSWQDRTLNMELMLSPQSSRLLFNKHKSLNTRCNNALDLYEKQVGFLVKGIAVEKRLLERYRSKLVSRQKELVVQRSQSAQEMRNVELLTVKDRSRSAPVGSCRGSSPPRYEGRRSRGVFLTEIEDDRTSKLSKNKRVPKDFQRAPTYFKKYKPQLPTPTSTSVVFKKKTYVTFGVRAPSVSTESDTSESEEEPEVEVKDEAHPLDVKIKNFLDEVKAFNEKPASLKRCRGSRDLFAYLKENENSSDGVAVKKYTNVTTDRQRLEAAFNSFCKTKSREALVTMMRLAAKMKANAAQARNTNPVVSVVPVVAVMKSSRVFMSLRSRVKPNRDETD